MRTIFHIGFSRMIVFLRYSEGSITTSVGELAQLRMIISVSKSAWPDFLEMHICRCFALLYTCDFCSIYCIFLR